MDRYQIQPKLPAVPVGWVLDFEHFQHSHQRGVLSIFFSDPRQQSKPQYISFIHNYQLWILFSTILYVLSTTIHTIIHTKYQPISFSQISKYHSYFPSRHSIALSPSFPYPGTLFPDKNIPKCTSIPSPTYTHKSFTFRSKIPKNGLKSLFFNR